MTNFPSFVIKKALINSILRFVKTTSMSHVSWINSLRTASTTNRCSIASLAGTYNSPAQKQISMAVEDAEIQPARLNQRFLKQKPGIQIDYLYVSFLTALILFCLQTNSYAADSIEKVLISADHMQLNIKSGHSVYTGDVRISQGKMVLTGDEITLEQKNNDVESITVTGKPARYTNVTEKGEPVEAESEHMFYRASQNKLEMTTNARLKQTGHQISSQKITYDTLKRIIIAGGNDTHSMNSDPKANNGSKSSNNAKQNQRVNITLTPEKKPQRAEESAAE